MVVGAGEGGGGGGWQSSIASALRKTILCWGLTCQPLCVILCCLPEKGRTDRRDSREDESEGQGAKRKRNESVETEEIKIPSLPLPAARIAGLVQL